MEDSPEYVETSLKVGAEPGNAIGLQGRISVDYVQPFINMQRIGVVEVRNVSDVEC